MGIFGKIEQQTILADLHAEKLNSMDQNGSSFSLVGEVKFDLNIHLCWLVSLFYPDVQVMIRLHSGDSYRIGWATNPF